MKKVFSIVLCVCLLAGLFPAVLAAEPGQFADLSEDAWYAEYVDWCLETGLMNGVSGTSFAPEDGMSRAMAVTMLWRVEGCPYVNYAMSFQDVPEGEWYTEAVRWAAAEKLVNGYSAEVFGTNDLITREQMAAMLYRYAEHYDEGFVGAFMFLMPVEDFSEVSEWAANPVRWCYMKDVMRGRDNGLLAPKDNMKRCEAAAMFMRFCRLNRINLGDSGLCVYAPIGYRLGVDDMEEYQDGYYCRGANETDFDVYVWEKDPGATVVSEAEEEAAQYAGGSIGMDSVNGVDYAWYTTTEEADGKTYTTRTVIFDADTDFAEIVFWLDGPNAAAFADSVVNSLDFVEKPVTVGDNGLMFWLPAGYRSAEDPDAEEYQIAYYRRGDDEMDFDVYEWVKDEGATAQSEAEAEAAELGGTVYAESFRGIDIAWYETVEEADGESYRTLTYIFDVDPMFVEMVFWMDGEEAQTLVDGILEFFLPLDRTLQLGTSDLSISLPAGYKPGEDTMEEYQIAYYCRGAEETDFDIYQWAKDEGATVESEAAAEAAEYENASPVSVGSVNGVSYAWYETTEADEGASYTTRTYIFDADTDFVEIVFWLDGWDPEGFVDDILSSLEKAEAPAEEADQVIPLGTSGLSITVPGGYRPGEDTMEEYQIAYYCRSAEETDFDLYQWVKDEGATVESEANEEATAYDGAVVSVGSYNGIPAAWYMTKEEADGESYRTFTIILDADSDFAEIVFWMDGAEAESFVDRVLNSLAKADTVLPLGTTGLSITVPLGYMPGEDTMDEYQIAYYCRGEDETDFDVYQWAKEEGATVVSEAIEEAAEYGSSHVSTGEFNGIAAAWYETTEEADDESYTTVTYIFDAGADFVEIVFWLDGADAQTFVDGILASLTK